MLGAVALVLAAAFDQTKPTHDGLRQGEASPFARLADSLRDRVLDVVGPDEIVERLDINAVLERVDLNALLERLDVNAVLDRVEIDRVLDRVDVEDLLARIDPDLLLARVDVNALLTRIEPDLVLARVDPDLLLHRVDVNALIDRVDVNTVLDRVDVDALLDRIDVDRLVDRVDVADIVQRAGIPDVIAESTGTMAESLLDLVRRQLLGLDVVTMRTVMRILGRDVHALPAGPAMLVGERGPDRSMPDPSAAAIDDVSGHYAGPVTRATAHVLDTAIAGGAFTLLSGALGSVLRTVGLPASDPTQGGALLGVSLAAWFFVYWWVSTAVAGRTPGMALIGLRIVARDGSPLGARAAFLRVVTLPLSFVLFGLGLLGILVDRERRALHDVIAGSTVVYDWGGRAASLPTPLARWLARHAATADVPPGAEG